MTLKNIFLFDTHQHLIYREQAGYDWTAGIDVLKNGDFNIDDYQKLTQDKNVVGTIFMEAGVNDADYQNETRFIAKLCQDSTNNMRGIISSIRPETNDGFNEWLEESISLGVIGYRRVLHVVDNELSKSDTFRNNVKQIGQANKTFDLCFLAGQLPIAIELAKACDKTSLILNHCGVPNIAGNELDPWKENIKELAALENVSCKLSGIMAYCDPANSNLAAITPFVDHVLECFGTERIVWGSDWPVVNMAHGIATWIDVSNEILNKLSADEAKKIAYSNAQRIYQVNL